MMGDLTALRPRQDSGRHPLLGCRALPWGSGLQAPAAGMAPQASGLGHLTYVLWVFLFFVHLQGQWGIYLSLKKCFVSVGRDGLWALSQGRHLFSEAE